MPLQYSTRLDPAAARAALLSAAQPETLWIDVGLASGAIYRELADGIELRFKRALVRVLVLNVFRVRITANDSGGALLAATQGWRVSRAAAPIGLAILAFFTVPFSLFGDGLRGMPKALGLAAVLATVGLLFGLFVAFVLADSDRERFAEYLRRAASAGPV